MHRVESPNLTLFVDILLTVVFVLILAEDPKPKFEVSGSTPPKDAYLVRDGALMAWQNGHWKPSRRTLGENSLNITCDQPYCRDGDALVFSGDLYEEVTHFALIGTFENRTLTFYITPRGIDRCETFRHNREALQKYADAFFSQCPQEGREIASVSNHGKLH